MSNGFWGEMLILDVDVWFMVVSKAYDRLRQMEDDGLFEVVDQSI